MTSYSELLKAVDSLIAFADAIEPIVKHRQDGTEYLDLSQQDEARSKAREHTVLTLADALGLSSELPKPKTGVFYSKLGMPIWPQMGQSDAFYRRWRNKIGHFRAVVAELAGSPPPTKSGAPKRTGSRKPCADDQIIAALCLIHRYENGSIGNDEPATLAEIASSADVKSPCISKFFKKYHKHFGSKHAYEVACRNRTLGTKLTLLNRDLPEVYKPGDFE